MPYTGDVSKYPSDYLHYWWEHYDAGSSFLSSNYFNDKQSILAGQLRNLKKRNQRHFARVAAQTNISKDTFSRLYTQLKNDPKSLTGDVDPSQMGGVGKEPSSIEDAINTVNNVDPWLEELNKGASVLRQAAEKMTNPNTVQEWGEAVLYDYIRNSISAGRWQTADAGNLEKAAAEILINFRNQQTDKSMFDVPTNLYTNADQAARFLSNAEREVLAILASSNIAGSSKSVGSIVKSNWGSSDILGQWKNQCNGLANYAGSKTHEVASAMALLSAADKFFEKEEQIASSLKANASIGSKNIKISKVLVQNKAWEDLKRRAGSSTRGILNKRSKSDAEVTINTNGTDVSFLRATAKKNLSYYPQNPLISRGHTGAYLSLHSNGSFVNFLNREMGMSSSDFHSVIQMLVARSARTDLSSYWEKLKENVAYRGFLSALAGFSREEQAQFMTIGDNIIAIEDIVQSAINEDVMPYATYSPNYSRSDFMGSSSWVGKTGPNMIAAIERSEIAWNNTSRMLNSMILNIKMDITKNFIANRLG